MSEKKHNIFYKTTNLVNGKFYYGIHSTDKLEDGYFGSGKLLKRAVKKHGTENFSKEIIADYPTRKEASDHEKNVVTIELAEDEMCYNMKSGGDNECVNSSEVCSRISQANLIFAKNNPNRKHTPETLELLSKSQKHRYLSSSAWNKGLTKNDHPAIMSRSEKISGENHHFYGKPMPESVRNNISKAVSGVNHCMYGLHHTEDTKLKMQLNSPKRKPCIINGIEYLSSFDASRKLNISRSTVQSRLKSPSELFKYWFTIDSNKDMRNK